MSQTLGDAHEPVAAVDGFEIRPQIKPLSDVMAAEVVGIDLSQPMAQAVQAQVHAAFLAYKVLAFRNQTLTKQQQIAFTQQFGTLERHALSNAGSDGVPLVHVVTNLDDNGVPSGKVGSTQWHSDKSFRPEPSMATILHAITLPPDGGDTCFADMHAAYEALPAQDKAELDGVRVVHSWEHSRGNAGRVLSAAEIADAPPMSHPLVRVHPETGEKCLFLGTHAAFLEGIEAAVGLARIEALEAHATEQRFIYRHTWQPGDVLMWDNRCLMHRADANFDAANHPRILHRTCLRGTPT